MVGTSKNPKFTLSNPSVRGGRRWPVLPICLSPAAGRPGCELEVVGAPERSRNAAWSLSR